MNALLSPLLKTWCENQRPVWLMVPCDGSLFRHRQGPGDTSTATELGSRRRWHVASPASCKWVFRSPCSTPASAPALVRGDARHNTFTCLRDRRLNSHSSAPSRLPYSICRKKNPAVPCSQTKFSLGYVYYTVLSCPPAHNYSEIDFLLQ